MKKCYAVFALVLLALISLPAKAARLDIVKPGEQPVMNVTVTEKGDTITMTFDVFTSYNSCTLQSVSVWESYEKPMKEIKPTVVKGGTWKITFSIPKAKVKTAKMHLSYTMPDAGSKGGVHLNQVNLDVVDFYKHYKPKAKK